MAKYRKLGRTSDQRKALLRSQVTSLLYRGKIVTTEAKAKEIRKIAEGIIALGIKEKDNFDTVTVTAKVARKDKDGKRVKEVVDGKKQTKAYRTSAQYAGLFYINDTHMYCSSSACCDGYRNGCTCKECDVISPQYYKDI